MYEPQAYLDYLWGIEIPIELDKVRNFRYVFRLPMRNWNCWKTVITGLGFTYLDYLWGIEIIKKWTSHSKKYRVFRLPMRNWNQLGSSARRPSTAYLDYLWGIEILRPMLQRWSRLGYLDYLWGIEIERHGYNFSARAQVFRLPMRNWNPSELGTATWGQTYLDYLWGIEIGCVWPCTRSTPPYLDYLWGIEIALCFL